MNNEFKAGNRVHVDFFSESRTEFSGKKIEGEGVIDRAEDGYVYGRLDSGQTFMCSEADVVVINDNAETEFQKWIEASPEYQTLIFQHGERLFIRRNGQYEILSIRLARRLWAMIEGHRFTINAMGEVLVEKDKQIIELKDRVATYRIETYESHGRIDYAYHCFMRMDRNQFYKNIEAIICGKLRHPDFSFDRSRIKAIRGTSD